MFKYILDNYKITAILLVIFLSLNLILNWITFLPIFEPKIDHLLGNDLASKSELLLKRTPSKIKFMAIGSSMTEYGFRPSVFEANMPADFKSYNMGIFGSRADIFTYFLEQIYPTSSQTPVLLIEASEVFSADDNPYSIVHYEYLIRKNPTIFFQLFTNPFASKKLISDIILSFCSFSFRFRSLLSPFGFENRVMRYLSKPKESIFLHTSDHKKVPLEDRGWTFRPDASLTEKNKSIDAEILAAQLNFFKDQQIQPNLQKLEYLLAYCSEKHITVILVKWPEHPKWERTIAHSKKYSDLQNKYSKLARHYHMPLITLDLPYSTKTQSYFLDKAHLNAEGAEIVTQMLKEKLLRTDNVSYLMQKQN